MRNVPNIWGNFVDLGVMSQSETSTQLAVQVGPISGVSILLVGGKRINLILIKILVEYFNLENCKTLNHNF